MQSTLSSFIALLLCCSSAFAQEIVPPDKPVAIPVPEAEPEIFRYVEVSPEFPGGMDSLKAYIARNLVYPQTALDLGIEGRCYLQFIISSQGNVSNVNVARGVPDCPECDKEAVRIVRKMPKWIPAQNGGKNVHSYYNLPIRFSLDNVHAQASPSTAVAKREPIIEHPQAVQSEPASEVFVYTEVPAEFPGGKDSLKAYIEKHLQYPASAREIAVSGKCYLHIVVSASGNISNVKVVRGVPDCPDCDNEAIRLVKSMPKWIPGKNGGTAVHSVVNLPISFTLQ